jgi:protein TonB
MKYIFTFFIFFIALFCDVIAQDGSNIIYFDTEWKEVKRLQDAEYYRIVKAGTDSLNHKIYMIEDYYIIDALQMRGACSDKKLKVKTGKYTWFYRDGKVKSECTYVKNQKQGISKGWYNSGGIQYIAWYTDDKLNGKSSTWQENGARESEYFYKNDTLNGPCKYWYKNDSLSTILCYKNGKIDGRLFTFYNNGVVRRTDIYKDDQLINGKCFTINNEDTTYFQYEVQAIYPGGHEAFLTYLTDNIIYPQKMLNKGIQGKVILQFVIDTDGSLIDTEIKYSDNIGFNAEALRVMNNSPKWLPAQIDGYNVQKLYLMPIYFKF